MEVTNLRNVSRRGHDPENIGSNPIAATIWSIRSSARMPPCHGGEEGSIPSWTAT
jgi:hypothetical protein